MRGGVTYEMSSTCVQGGLPRPLGGYQPNMMIEPQSPASAWQYHSILPVRDLIITLLVRLIHFKSVTNKFFNKKHAVII